MTAGDQWTSEMPTTSTGSEASGTSKPAEVAKTAASEASNVTSAAAGGAKEVAGEAAAQAKQVASQAKEHVSQLVHQTREELTSQASSKSEQAAGGLRTLSGQISALAEGRPGEAGPLAGYLNDAQSKVNSFAQRLEQGGPQGLMDDVIGFARRRPGAFLIGAVGAGFVVGRMVRSGALSSSSDGDSGQQFVGMDGGYITTSNPGYATTGLDPAFPAPTTSAIGEGTGVGYADESFGAGALP